MKNLFSSIFCAALFCASVVHIFAQGSLTPPGAPSVTMKTLDQLDAKLEKRTAISTLPYTISSAGSYYVTTNLSGSSGMNGIQISTGNVTLDLNGFNLAGVAGATAKGIYIPNSYTNITVRNGTLTGWTGDAINTGGSSLRNFVVENVSLSANGGYAISCAADASVKNCVVTSNSSGGIYIDTGVIAHCVVRDNRLTGITVLTEGVVDDCWIYRNGGFGIYFDVNGNGEIRNCQVENCTYSGIDGLGVCLIRDCVALHNATFNGTGYAGIYASDNSRVINCIANYNGASTNGYGINVSSRVHVEGCTANFNQSDGIHAVGSCTIIKNHVAKNGVGVSAAGIHTTASGNYIDGNYARENIGDGIKADAGANNDIIVRNTSQLNTVVNYTPSTGTGFAPVQLPSTATNAWGNF